MEDLKLKNLAGQLETAAYVFDLDAFAHRAQQVREAFGPETGLCFSIKANPFLLCGLPAAFDKVEVCSPGELTICEKTGVDMKKVIFSGVNKGAEDVGRAMDDGVGVFTAESLRHVELIHDAAVQRGIQVPVLLRLTGGSQFGMDEEDVKAVIANREAYPGIRILGLHYFTGTQKTKPAVIEKELRCLEDFVTQVEQTLSFSLTHVEYGAGLAVDYFNPAAEESELARLNAVAPSIRALAAKVNLTVEMGRFFAAPCGYYFTQVADVKINCGIRYAIVDGGLHQLKYDGQLYGMQIPMLLHVKSQESAGDLEKWTLCGSLCTTADVLAKNVPLHNLEIGDILVFKRTGAYSAMEGMSIFLSRDMPVIATYSQTQGLIIRRPRILTDQFNTKTQ